MANKPTTSEKDIKSTVKKTDANPTPTPVQKDFNPLDGNIDEKTYAGAAAQQFTPEQLQGDIPEPSFQPPPPEDLGDIPTSGSGGVSKKKEEKKQPQETFNPDMQELPDKDKMEAAEKGAKFALDIYASLHGLANNQLQISDRKLNKLQASGELDMNVIVPYGDKGGVRFGDFVADFNSQSSEVLTVSDEFREDVMPPLTRVFAKRGHGMTDEQYLMFAFGKDIVTKTMIFFQMKSTVNQIISFGKDQTASGGYSGVVQSNNQPVYQEQAPATAPAPVMNQEPPPVVPIQDAILEKHLPAASNSSGLPQFGNPAHLSNVDKTQASTEKITQTAKARLRNTAIKIKNSKKQQSDIPVPGKKRGRKLGSKNRIKK